jgi:hypothetical protein
MPNQKTARLSPGNPPYELSTDDLNRAGGLWRVLVDQCRDADLVLGL